MTRKFRILAGCHSEGLDSEGVPIIYRRGDVFESGYDLDRLFNSPGSVKFEALDGPTAANKPLAEMTDEELVAEVNRRKAARQAVDPAPPTPREDALGDMTKKELEQLAAAEEIDLGAARTREDMVSVIRAARNAA